ncbi:MAG TPA: hypothetical protein VIV60_19260 [Polyangiaceae bacterium]
MRTFGEAPIHIDSGCDLAGKSLPLAGYRCRCVVHADNASLPKVPGKLRLANARQMTVAGTPGRAAMDAVALIRDSWRGGSSKRAPLRGASHTRFFLAQLWRSIVLALATMGRARVAVLLILLSYNAFADPAVDATGTGRAPESENNKPEVAPVAAPLTAAPTPVTAPTPAAPLAPAPTPVAPVASAEAVQPSLGATLPHTVPTTPPIGKTAPPLSEPVPVREDTTSPDAFTHAKWFVGVDRLSLIGAWSVEHTTPDGIHVSENGTQATLIGGGASTGATIAINPLAVPRLFVDRIARNRFTIGFGASLYKTSGGWDAERSNQTMTGDGLHSWLYAIAPRLGYLIPVTEAAAAWVRGGVSWSQQRSDASLAHNRSSLGTFDCSLAAVFRIAKPLAVSLAIDLSLPLGGMTYVDYDPGFASRNNMPIHQQLDATLRFLGLQLGALFYQ